MRRSALVAAFIGKTKDDLLGRAYSHDIRAAGVGFATKPAVAGPSTGRCYVLVTPDGERTMNTYLGAAQDLSAADIDADAIAASAIVYLEGYLWDPQNAKEAFLKAAKIAHQTGRKVALTLSDAFCVDRWRDEFLQLMRSRTVDLIFANEAELHSLYQSSDFDAAIAALRADIDVAVVTRSEKGCLVIGPDGVEAVPAFPVDRVVDTTGAGRPVCRRVPLRLGARRRRPHLRPPRRAGCRRSDPAYRGAAGSVAARPRARERPFGLTFLPPRSARRANETVTSPVTNC